MLTKIKNKQLEIISNFDINNNRLINVGTPVSGTDAVNKDYLNYTSLNAALGTGLYTGGVLNTVDNTHFSITAGDGYIVNNVTKEITYVSWDDFPNVEIMSFGPTDITITIGIGINGNGVAFVYQQIPKFTSLQRHQYISLGEIFIHPTKRNVYNKIYTPIYSRDLPTIVDIHLIQSPISLKGNSVTPNGTNLFLNVSTGTFVGYSINSIYDKVVSNETIVNAINHIHFFTAIFYNNGTTAEWRYGGDTETFDNIDPTHWSNGVNWSGGVFTLQDSTPSKYNLRILCRCAITGLSHFMVYPTQSIEFQNIVDAESALNALGVNVPDEILSFATPLCYIILRGNATDLSDPTQCKFIPIHSISATVGSLAGNASDIAYIGDTAINLNGISNVEDALTAINNKIENIDYVENNLDMDALSGTTIHLATNTSVIEQPTTLVRVEVNGVPVSLGDGIKTLDCFFSNDGGTTARLLEDIQIGDYLYWNETTSSYTLEIDDKISFIYMYI